jgi:hypothetical protein
MGDKIKKVVSYISMTKAISDKQKKWNLQYSTLDLKML